MSYDPKTLKNLPRYKHELPGPVIKPGTFIEFNRKVAEQLRKKAFDRSLDQLKEKWGAR